MECEISIGASRERLILLAHELLDACQASTNHVAVTIYAKPNGPGNEVILNFSNDDMEDRNDLETNIVLVDVAPL